MEKYARTVEVPLSDDRRGRWVRGIVRRLTAAGAHCLRHALISVLCIVWLTLPPANAESGTTISATVQKAATARSGSLVVFNGRQIHASPPLIRVNGQASVA